MNIEQEYAVKAQVQNNPVKREVDVRQKREFGRTALLAGLVLAMVLFSAWQRNATIAAGINIEHLQKALDTEQVLNRQLRLNLETLEAPQVIALRAQRELGLEPASPSNTFVIEVERHHAARPTSAVVARAH